MIRDVRIVPLRESAYIKPKSMLYNHKGQEKRWDLVEVHDSVAILLVDPEKEHFVIVKQLRPSVYLHNGDGHTYELCAGIVDKDASLAQIAKEEIMEECGYDVPLDEIEKITSFYSSVGFGASVQTLYYAEVTQVMKTGEGGGVDIEDIEVVYLPFSKAREFLYDETKAKTPGIMFAFEWFFAHHRK